MVDYLSNYFEFAELHKKTSLSVIAQFKVQFARHGNPSSREFEGFAKIWKFEHIILSPRFPQSNGKAVKTYKALLMKAREDRQDPLLALLGWRNTPSEGFNTSPVQGLMGRRTRTLLPTTHSLLEPKIDKQTAQKLTAQNKSQAIHYNTGMKSLAPLRIGETIRMDCRAKEPDRWGDAYAFGATGPTK